MQDNVRGALALVAKGEAKLGVVYGSDVLAEPKVAVAATFPEDFACPDPLSCSCGCGLAKCRCQRLSLSSC